MQSVSLSALCYIQTEDELTTFIFDRGTLRFVINCLDMCFNDKEHKAHLTEYDVFSSAFELLQALALIIKSSPDALKYMMKELDLMHLLDKFLSANIQSMKTDKERKKELEQLLDCYMNMLKYPNSFEILKKSAYEISIL